MLNSRARAALIIASVMRDKINLDLALAEDFQKNESDHAFIQTLCYGTMRFYHCLDFMSTCLLKKKLGSKDSDLQALILVGLYQLFYLDTPSYAVISSTVEGAKQLQKVWAANLINAVLRNADRQRDSLLAKVEQNEVARTSHPAWLLTQIKKAYPQNWQQIISANNQKAPFTLRVNQQKISREAYLEKLLDYQSPRQASPATPPLEGDFSLAHLGPFSPYSLYLNEPMSVENLPGFADGEVSVQDEAAQLAADLLDLSPTCRVLDACAAPGGKTTHILEVCPSAEVVAVEISEQRSLKIHENLKRTGTAAKVIVSDVSQLEHWWDGNSFDRILLDAPCSALGVIRRHPDIKLLRTEQEIKSIVKLQAGLLKSLWRVLKPGGILVYATCSILPVENQEQIQAFSKTQIDALLNFERVLLPEAGGTDGFYYARLVKNSI